MSRRHYLVSYDIADDKRRTLLFKYLEGQGDHVQFSVFLCDFSPTERARLSAKIADIIHHTEDQVILLDLGPADHPLDHGLEVFGAPYQPMVRTLVV